MQRPAAEKNRSKTVKLLNIVTVIVAVAALIIMIRMINELHGAFNRDPYSSMEYSLQSGDYADMVRNYYYRSFDVAPFETAYSEEYHVAEYADAAFRHGLAHTGHAAHILGDGQGMRIHLADQLVGQHQIDHGL